MEVITFYDTIKYPTIQRQNIMKTLLVLDVDGVLTDGSINIGSSGEVFKSFNVKDGMGIGNWLSTGREVVIITGRESELLTRRAAELGIETVYQGISDKKSVLRTVTGDREVELSETVYVGDDVSDIEAMELVGLSVAPADAHPTVQNVADIVTQNVGGDGAVREITDSLLSSEQTVLGVIPARYGSSRYPGKPLAEIAGTPMIEHVYSRASEATALDELVVATDDEQILTTVEDFGGDAIMTATDHQSGTDRVYEVATKENADVIVNIQGDEPLIDPAVIDETVNSLVLSPARMSTPITRITDAKNFTDENTVKVVFDTDGLALYFSRAPIPTRSAPTEAWKHIGLYAFERDLLLEYPDLESTLEGDEDLEQLRVLEQGFDIQTVKVDYDGPEVNVPADISTVERQLETND